MLKVETNGSNQRHIVRNGNPVVDCGPELDRSRVSAASALHYDTKVQGDFQALTNSEFQIASMCPLACHGVGTGITSRTPLPRVCARRANVAAAKARTQYLPRYSRKLYCLLGGGEESVFPTLEYRRSTGFWLLGSTPAERKSISTVATRMV